MKMKNCFIAIIWAAIIALSSISSSVISKNPATDFYKNNDESYLKLIMLLVGTIKDLNKTDDSYSFKAVRVRILLIGIIKSEGKNRIRFVMWSKVRNQNFSLDRCDDDIIKERFYGIIRPHFVCGVNVVIFREEHEIPEMSRSAMDKNITITSAPQNLSWESILIRADRDNVVVSFNNGDHHTIGTELIPMSDIGATGYVTAGDTITVHEPLDENITITLIYEPTGDTIAEFQVHT